MNAPAPATGDMTFGEFGEAFMGTVFTEERVKALIRGIVEAQSKRATWTLNGTGFGARLTVGGEGFALRRELVGDAEIGFAVTLPIRAELTALAGAYEGQIAALAFVVDLALQIQTRDPLVIYAHIPPLTATQIRDLAAYSLGDLVPPINLDLLVARGIWELIKLGAPRVVPGAAASFINAQLQTPQARAARTFDVFALVAGATGPTAVFPATKLTEEPGTLPLGHTIAGTLPTTRTKTAGNVHIYGVELRSGDELTLRVDAQTTVPLPFISMHNQYGLTIDLLGPNGRVLHSEMVWKFHRQRGEWGRDQLTFPAVGRAGRYRVRLQHANTLSSPVHYRLRASLPERPPGDTPGPRIAFAEFGVRFMHGVVTRRLLKQELDAVLREPLAIPPAPPAAVEAQAHPCSVGEIVAIHTVGPDTQRLVRVDPLRTILFDVTIPLSLQIQIDALGHTLPFALELAPRVRMWAVARRALIVYIGYQPLEPGQIEIKEGKGNEFIRRHLLEDRVRETVARTINEKLEESRPIRTKDIEKLVRDAFARFSPGPPAGAPAFATALGEAEVTGTVGATKADFRTIRVKGGDTVDFDVLVRTVSGQCFSGCNASFAVLDAEDCVLAYEGIPLPRTNRPTARGRIKLRFTPEEDGEYRYRVRNEECADGDEGCGPGDDIVAMNYVIKLTKRK